MFSISFGNNLKDPTVGIGSIDSGPINRDNYGDDG